MKIFSATVSMSIGLSVSALGQTIFNAILPGEGGGGVGTLLREQDGIVTRVNTGVPSVFLPQLSMDGRFITFSGVDPLRPGQASSDLFLFDRATGGTTRLIDNTARQNRDGSITTIQPLFSALSPSNSVVVLNHLISTTAIQGGGGTNFLEIHPVPANGGDFQIVEIGLPPAATNFHSSEFVGISWLANGSFATSAEIEIPSVGGNTTTLPGIVLYGFNPQTQGWQRVAQLSQPTNATGLDQFQIFPSFSPNGQRLAYFNITASPFINQPAQATLVVANGDGSAPRALFNFNQGFFPLGLTWSVNGGQLILSLAEQASTPVAPGASSWPSRGVPETAFIRAIDSVNGGAPFQLAGINAGFSPSVVLGSNGGISPGIRETSLKLDQQTDGSFQLSASGLEGEIIYELESSTTLTSFGNTHQFTGNDLMNGISIPNEGEKYFRLRKTE